MYLITKLSINYFLGPNNDKSHLALNHTVKQFKHKYNMSDDDYKLYELIVIERKPHKNGPQWKFAGAFYYALVVLTLIGYGHSTANTTVGKVTTMFKTFRKSFWWNSLGHNYCEMFDFTTVHMFSITTLKSITPANIFRFSSVLSRPPSF